MIEELRRTQRQHRRRHHHHHHHHYYYYYYYYFYYLSALAQRIPAKMWLDEACRRLAAKDPSLL